MEINVKLFNSIGKLNTKAFEITNEDLVYNFIARFGTNTKQILTLQNDTIQKRLILQNGKVYIPRELIFAGELKGILEVQIDNTIINRYTMEKLILTQTKEQINAIPEIEALKEKINTLEQHIKGIENFTKTTRQLVLELNNITEQIGGNE